MERTVERRRLGPRRFLAQRQRQPDRRLGGRQRQSRYAARGRRVDQPKRRAENRAARRQPLRGHVAAAQVRAGAERRRRDRHRVPPLDRRRRGRADHLRPQRIGGRHLARCRALRRRLRGRELLLARPGHPSLRPGGRRVPRGTPPLTGSLVQARRGRDRLRPDDLLRVLPGGGRRMALLRDIGCGAACGSGGCPDARRQTPGDAR